jgi:hypothetical protein
VVWVTANGSAIIIPSLTQMRCILRWLTRRLVPSPGRSSASSRPPVRRVSIVAFMDEDMADEAAGCAERRPAATAGMAVIV